MTFPIYDEENTPIGSLEKLRETKENFGMIPNIEKIMAGVPPLLATYKFMIEHYETTTLSPVEKQVVQMTSNYENECSYCIPWHTLLSTKVGMKSEDIEALRTGTALSDPKLNALRSFTKALVVHRGKITQSELQHFFDAGYCDIQAMEVILGISMKVISNYTNAIAGIPLDKEVETLRWKKPFIKEQL